ncbi:MAG TPA: uridine kinase [Anaerolineae bacterium]|nr:uridine kinase [Anaerolineae bacterium]
MYRDDLFAQIADTLAGMPTTRARLVGLNGVDTSGKTVFTNALAEFLAARGQHVTLIHGDDFHHPRALRSQGPDPVRGYIAHAFNLPLLEAALLAPARRGASVDKTLTLLDLDSDAFTLTRRYVIRPDTVVLVEGVLLFRPPVDEYFDLRIFLHVSFDEVLRRVAVRDVPRYGPGIVDRYHARYIPAQQWYLATYRPQERSDFVVDNTDYQNPVRE